jgi:hypothetical protein
MKKKLTESPTISWMGYEWLNRETWGRAHYKHSYKWYDPSCVIVGKSSLKLLTKYNPKRLIVFNPDTGKDVNILPQTGIGLISCQHPFHFGEYEIIAKLPYGKYLWPAIWLWDLNTWPPEIDILEAYSNSRNSYFKWWKFPPYSIKSNFHYTDDDGKQEAGAKNLWVGFRQPQNRFIKFQMTWTPDKIEIGANGCITRRLTGEVMKHFQQPMRFVINNGVSRAHPWGSPPSVFEIKRFSYSKL